MKIELSSLTQTVLVIPGNTGMVYTNQVGGTECDQPEMEGGIVPIEYDIQIENPLNSLTFKLCELFPEGNPGIIDQVCAENIQKLLDASPFTKGVEVNWNKLKQSKESWLHVTVKGTLDDTIDLENVNEAILTWPNSD